MRMNITARRFKLNEDLREFTEKEVGRLSRYYEGIVDIEVILSWEKFYRLAEIKIGVHGTILTAQERSEEMHKAIRLTVDKLERQLVKYKDKLHAFGHEKAVEKTAELDFLVKPEKEA